jgi:hypothetical protein
MREMPGFVKSVLHLVKDVGINFYLAYAFATKTAITGSGHHILSDIRAYGSIYKNIYTECDGKITINEEAVIKYLSEVTISLRHAIGIQRFVSHPGKYDPRRQFGRFNCSRTIEGISSIIHNIGFDDLFKNEIIDAVMSDDDDEVAKYIIDDSKPKLKAKGVPH